MADLDFSPPFSENILGHFLYGGLAFFIHLVSLLGQLGFRFCRSVGFAVVVLKLSQPALHDEKKERLQVLIRQTRVGAPLEEVAAFVHRTALPWL